MRRAGSWLSERAGRRERPRPYPVTDLAVAIGLRPDDPRLTSQLVAALGMSRGWVLRCRTLGLSETQADEWATRAGVHPMSIWPRWGSGLRGLALVEANRDRCRCGRPYDRRDSRGRRVCRACGRERVARFREKSRNSLVVAVVTVPPDHRAPLVALDAHMPPQPRPPRAMVRSRVPVDVAEQMTTLAAEAGLTVSAWACMTLTAAVRRPVEREDVA